MCKKINENNETHLRAKKPKMDERKPNIDFSLTKIEDNTSSYFVISEESDILL